MTPALEDARVRARLQEDLDTTFVVEAAAGTGKTTILVARILALLRSGRTALSRIVAVTFTEKAAGEMKLRIRAEVEKARAAPGTPDVERRRLEAALEELEGARVGTIHSLCSDLLRERPIQAAVDPLFEVAAEDDAHRLLALAFDAWFPKVLSSSPEGIRRFLRRAVRGGDWSARKQLRDAAFRLVERRDFDAPWRIDSFDRTGDLDRVVTDLEGLGALAARAARESWLKKGLNEVQRFVEDLQHRERVSGRDYDGLEAGLRELTRPRQRFWNWQGSGNDFGDGLTRQEVLKRRDAVKASLDELVRRCDADLAARLWGELQPVVEEYEALKSAEGKLDFVDLLLKTRDMLRSDGAVRTELQARFSHVFVDEFQDTDPLQAEILLLLCSADPAECDADNVRTVPGKLFAVGDPKQSIYAFRRADVMLYHRIKERLVSQGAELLYLSKSFRAHEPIQSAVNAAFALAMGVGTGSQARYVPLELGREDPPPARPTLVALPVPRPWFDYSPPKITSMAIERSLPDAVGAFIDFLVAKSGWTVDDPEHRGTPVPIQPRHICVLFRRFHSQFADVTRPYAAALEARRIPHVLVGGRSFHARDEVLAVRNALSAIEWPDDELAVFATLRGPLFALTDEALLAFRAAFGRMHPLRRLDLEAATPQVREVADALAILGRLHRRRNRRPIADTIQRLLEETRAHAGLAFWSAGEQALANVLHLTDVARRFEARGTTSFRAFVEHLHEEAENGEAEEARVVEEGTEGVRLMTVHKAKGLEFPVVILADLTSKPPSHASRFVDASRRLWAESLAGLAPLELVEHEEEALARDQEEAIRLAYVAATRARDLLVIPAVADVPHPGWLSVLDPAVYPKLGTARAPREAAGCRFKGRDAVIDRPDSADFDPETSPAPGEHVPHAGTHKIVWWDPSALDLDRQMDPALRREDILVKEEPESTRSLEALREWEAAHAERLRAAAVPSSPSTTVRTAAAVTAALNLQTSPYPLPSRHISEGLDGGSQEVRRLSAVAPICFPVEVTEAVRTARPTGPRFGALVHAILARAPLDAEAEALQKLARVQARLLGATALETAAAVDAARSALAHPVWQRARACPKEHVRREEPVLLRREDGVAIEGVLDLAFRDEAGSWTVVELKTEDPKAELPPEHHAQLALYVRAVEAATGEPTSGILMLV